MLLSSVFAELTLHSQRIMTVARGTKELHKHDEIRRLKVITSRFTASVI